MNDLVTTEQQPDSAGRPPLMAGGRPHAIVPQSMEDTYRLAKAVHLAGMAPDGFDTPEKIMVAMMHGLEVGLTPMAALQRIAVVNGRPTIWGDGAIGLVRSSRLCEYVKEWIEGEGDKRVAHCEAKRKGEADPVRRSYSVEDAIRAGLWDTRTTVRRKGRDGSWYDKANDAPWYRFPERMLQMRARAFCLRDLFADVLGGLYLREEIEDQSEQQALPAPTRRAPSPSTAPAIEHKPEREPEREHRAKEPAPAEDRQPDQAKAEHEARGDADRQDADRQGEEARNLRRRRAPSPSAAPGPGPTVDSFDPEAIRKRLVAALKKAKDENELQEAWDTIAAPFYDDALPPDQADWAKLYETRLHELREAPEATGP